MIGAHDLGGKRGFGSLAARGDTQALADEALFHGEWERRAFALTLAAGMLGQWNIDESRHARENQRPERYLSNSYYETWLVGLQTLLRDKGLLSVEEIESLPFAESIALELQLSGAAGQRSAPLINGGGRLAPIAPDPARAAELLRRGGPTLVDPIGEPAFVVGDRVRVLPMTQAGHTRAPQYVHGARGEVQAYNGVHHFPDEAAHRDDARPHPLYTVTFSSAELFPEAGAHAGDRVLVDLWEPYLVHE